MADWTRIAGAVVVWTIIASWALSPLVAFLLVTEVKPGGARFRTAALPFFANPDHLTAWGRGLLVVYRCLICTFFGGFALLGLVAWLS